MSDQKIASSGAAIFWEVAMDGNLANADGVEGADTMSATGTPSPAPAIFKTSWDLGKFFFGFKLFEISLQGSKRSERADRREVDMEDGVSERRRGGRSRHDVCDWNPESCPRYTAKSICYIEIAHY